MVLESLGSALKKGIDKIKSAVFVDKALIDSIIKDLQRALIMADVDISLVKALSEKIREQSSANVKGIEKKEILVKVLNDEIINIIGGEKQELELGKKDRILFVGLYGTGKTTTISKVAHYYKKRGKKIALLGLDVHRPAAPEQLEQLGKKLEVPTFIDKEEKDALKIYKNYEKQLEKYDLVLIDSAGRDALEKSLIKEISDISKATKPTHTILVIAADIGQAAKRQVEEFQKATKISGVIITRMDSSAKAGGALTAASQTQTPIYFIGTGEKPADLEQFNPQAFVSRLLGMGDLETLLDKIRSVTDEKEQAKMQQKFAAGELTLDDFAKQIESMSNVGGFGKIASMIPGLGSSSKIPSEMLEGQEGKVKGWKHAISSMTPEEKANPELLEKQTSRIQRISKGSGVSTTDIRQMLKQFKMIKELSGQQMQDPSQMSQKDLMKLAKKFGKKKMKFF